MEVFRHVSIVVTALRLAREEYSMLPGVAGEEAEVVFRPKSVSWSDFQRPSLDAPIRQEPKTGYATVGCDVLILFPDRLAEPFDFNVTRLFRQFLRQDQMPPVGMERLEQRRGETSR